MICSLPNAVQCGRLPHLERAVKGSAGLIHLLVQQPELHFVGSILLLVLLLVSLQATRQLEVKTPPEQQQVPPLDRSSCRRQSARVCTSAKCAMALDEHLLLVDPPAVH